MKGMYGFVGGLIGNGSRRTVSLCCEEAAVKNVTTSSASIAWSGEQVSTPFKVSYSATSGAGGSSWTSLRTVSRSRVILKGLEPSTQYNVTVTGGSSKSRVARASFTTMRAESSAGAESAAPEAEDESLPLTELSRLEIRTGKILECEKHPDADSLYVEKIDVGEEEPRTIISGLVKYVKAEDLIGRSVLVLCNLKPREMRGISSRGMLMCASNEDHSEVDPLSAPEGCPVGELVTFKGHRASPLDPGNRASKAFERVADDLKTNEEGIAMYQGWAPRVTSSTRSFAGLSLESTEGYRTHLTHCLPKQSRFARVIDAGYLYLHSPDFTVRAKGTRPQVYLRSKLWVRVHPLRFQAR